MTDREILEQLLEGQQQLFNGQKSMQADIKDLQQGQKSMQADIKDLQKGQKSMQKDIKVLQKDVKQIKKQIDVVYDWVDRNDLRLKKVEDVAYKGA